MSDKIQTADFEETENQKSFVGRNTEASGRRAGFKVGDLVKTTVKEPKKTGGHRTIERTFRIERAELPQGKSAWVYYLDPQDLTGTMCCGIKEKAFSENSLKLVPPPEQT